MKLNIISDLHCGMESDGSGEIKWFDFDPVKLTSADYLIVAGDTGYDDTEEILFNELRRKTEGKFRDILWIKGNHSYWFNRGDTVSENRYIDLVDGDVAVIGTTLWTSQVSEAECCLMNDYRNIRGFGADVKLSRFKEESKWLRDKWNEYKSRGMKVVIVTHHNPRSAEDLPEYSREHCDVETAYWVGDRSLDDIKPDIWICGHIHERIDTEIDGVRFIRNPIGYRWWPYCPNEDGGADDDWYNTVVEI